MITVFGETHTDPRDVSRIRNEIIKLSPSVILHELLYEDRCDTDVEIEERLRTCKEGGICDPRLNKDIYRLGKALGCKLIGIDIGFINTKLTLRESFELRERHMLKIIETCLVEFKGETIVIVVGDAHLRTTETDELGPASLVRARLAKIPGTKIVRSTSLSAEIH